MLTIILGGIITPLRSVFLTTKTIKTPTAHRTLNHLVEIPARIRYLPYDYKGEIVSKVRSALAAASNANPQGRLWTGKPFDCSPFALNSAPFRHHLKCGSPNMVFENMSLLTDPFLAELPSGYSTGLIRQYLPRINSTARRDIITKSDFPTNCDAIPDAFYVRYAETPILSSNKSNLGNWSLEACMPANLTQSPWRAVRTRQDFSEELYLNISLTTDGGGHPLKAEEQGGLFRISLDTTAGYFELPNYMNGEQPGPLLDDEPTSLCRDNCDDQTAWTDIDKSM